jgi:hypothetical protein
MRPQVTKGRVSFEWEPNEQTGPLEFSVAYSVSPIIRQTFESPQEGGEVELYDLRLESTLLIDDAQTRGHALEGCEEALESNDRLRQRVEEYCREDAGQRWESDQELAADAAIQRRRDRDE